MRYAEILGSISTLVLAIVLLYSFSTNPPVYEHWVNVAGRLVPPSALESGKAISIYVWEDLFPAVVALAVAFLAFVMALVVLLRRG
ncbi:MAG: hypothetical protein B9J98_04930 [Candidatus Terraquivivens tikiterensis]|uniref:Uncharacterized protein n=1 Tax=Candidatus Terraquivivens tikiterensis TaxID=1980982 RepID=A0A2R7Y3J9_9ARCH|nr:MAG: hypothetical protein B9J98_04930 [Candidatus Terraquivivens tikiterensis]